MTDIANRAALPLLRRVDSWREIAIANLPVAVFDTFYFLTAVLVNILYATGFGSAWPVRFIPDFMWSDFPETFGVSFWVLVLCPFIALPLVAIPTSRALRPLTRWSYLIAEFSKLPYAIVCTMLYAYVAYEFIRADAAHMFVSGTGTMGAVKQRFALQDLIGFQTRVVIMSLLNFLAIYSCVRAIRHKDTFWRMVAILNVIAMTACLVLLNMKWPIILFVITLGFAVFVVSSRFVILKTLAVMLCGVATYFVISVIILNAVPPPHQKVEPHHVQQLNRQPTQKAIVGPTPLVEQSQDKPAQQTSIGEQSYVMRVANAVEKNIGNLTVVALNRMGMAVPYYYDIFTRKGPFCGTFFDWAFHTSNLKCRPSLYVYNEMFHDEFKGKGTAPAAFQIYEYARGGWLGVGVSLLMAGLFFGAFMSLRRPAKESDMLATIFVMSAPSAYFLTQLPIEGAIIYDTGVAWWGAVVLINSAAASISRRHSAIRR